MKRTHAAAAMIALLLGTSACGAAEDAFGDAVNAAGCTAAQQAVKPIKDGARSATENLGVDPAAARRQLQALKSTVDAAATAASGEVKQSLKWIGADLDVLLDEARSAARGAVDQKVVDQARSELDTAVDDLTTIC